MPVRPATPEDAIAIAEVHIGTWRVAYRGIVPDAVLDALSVDDSAARWRARLSNPPHRTLVAERHGSVVGFATAGPSRDAGAAPGTGELFAIYVADSWGQRHGRALWEVARQILLTEGFAEATVWVLEENGRGRHFYERLGFTLEPGITKVEDRSGKSLTQVRYRTRLARSTPLTARRAPAPS